MNKNLRLIILGLVVIAAIGAYVFLHQGEISTDDAAIEADVVTISPKVSGYVVKLLVDDNQRVKAGDSLLEIDPTDYAIHLARSEANLAAAKARAADAGIQLETTKISAPSNLDSATASVAEAEANFERAQKDLARLSKLNNVSITPTRMDEAIAAEKTAKAALENAQAKLKTAQTAPQMVAAAQTNADDLAAQVKLAEADVAQAKKDLADTKILAPISGRVTRRTVEKGNYVQPGQQLFLLVSNDVWVVANLKETQLTAIRKGQKVAIALDAYPDLNLHGKVDSVQSGTGARFSAFPPENASGNYVKVVQRVPVKIILDEQPDPKLAIGPGLSIVPTIYTH